jgi:5-methylcytosine-specific restriction endonuclease McrA
MLYKQKYPAPKIGDVFFKWTVIGITTKNTHNNHRLCLCRCECGTERMVNVVRLWREESKSCKCSLTEEEKRQGARASYTRWACRNPEKIYVKNTEYRTPRLKQFAIYEEIRRTRKTKSGGSFTVAEWGVLCAHYGNICLRCTKHKKLTADHVIPVSKGGTSNIDNIQPLCAQCNSAKGTKTTDYRRTQR